MNNLAASKSTTSSSPSVGSNFVSDLVAADQASNKHGGRVVTRFPPEPNGYLHIGHAKSICLNFGLAQRFAGRCHLRFDDTNPAGESHEYVESIQRDVRWLGFDWGEHLYFASDYFEPLYQFAEELIGAGKAYVCSLDERQIREYRGTVTEAGRPSPYRERSIEENLELFRRMRRGEFEDGAHVLRAKIDMASPNMKMRDPLMYRIRHVSHYRTGDAWCIYPLYDFTHCLSDALEHVTHSVCTLEFENNRELYDWFVANVSAPSHPEQTEFARLNLTYTMMSKRRLLELVREKLVDGWDDPRMPTIAGLRRRGVTPGAIRDFADRIGVAKNNSTVDVALLEHCIREDLDSVAPRALAVLDPLELVIDSLPDGHVEELPAPLFPAELAREGARKLPFSKRLLIERSDFEEHPPPGFHRLAPGQEVRLRHGYLVRCVGVIKDERGRVVRVHCEHDPESLGSTPEGRRVRGTLHWVSVPHAIDVEVRLYDRLFRCEKPGEDDRDFREDINPESLRIVQAKVEPWLATAAPGQHLQFERHGFFFVEPQSYRPSAPVFNRVVSLKDTWAKVVARATPAQPSRSRQRPVAPAAVKAALGEDARVLVDQRGVGEEEARVIAEAPQLRGLFEQAFAVHANGRGIAAWIVNELRAVPGFDPSQPACSGAALGRLVALVDERRISGAAAKTVLSHMVAGEGEPEEIVETHQLAQIDDEVALGGIIDGVLASEGDLVSRYRAGNTNLFGALVGAVMRETRGKAMPQQVQRVLRDKLTR